MPEALPLVATFLATPAGAAVAGGVASAAVGYGATKVFGPKVGGINIPPPPGAGMIDPAGATAAADARRRQASAGGLNSTITGAGNAPATGTATSGSKSTLGS